MTPALIPRRILFGEAERLTPQLAPDGMRIAYLATTHEAAGASLWVGDLSLEDVREVAGPGRRGIIHFAWSKSARFLLYLRDDTGDELYQLRAVDVASGDDQALTDADGTTIRIVGSSAAYPDGVLVARNRPGLPVFDVWRIDIASGERCCVFENPGQFVDWVADADLEVRAAVAARDDGGFDLMVRSAGVSEWKQAISWDPLDSLSSGPEAFAGDSRHLYLLDARGDRTNRLALLDVETLNETTLYRHPDADIARVMISPTTRDIQAVAVLGARNEWHVLDDHLRADFQFIEGNREMDIYPFSRDLGDRFWILVSVSDICPGTFRLYRRAERSIAPLFSVQPALDAFTLAHTHSITVTARDGLRLHGYMTLPPGGGVGPHPLVIKIHSGPWTRDTWEYDAEVQWLANRGYACLRVNFRGSTGYGKAFISAGDREWGGRMQSDIFDAIDWAVASGIADPARIGMFGLSYGGYAALMAAAAEPERIRCVVDLMGPTDLPAFLTALPPHLAAFRGVFHQRVGDPDRDKDRLWANSPLAVVDCIKSPVFVAHGANDPRVAQSHSDRLVAALRERGVECEYERFEDEGHGLAKADSRNRLYAALERFLARHLGGWVEL